MSRTLMADVPSLQHGTHECQSCRVMHYEPYETWCRAERMRVHPSNFEHWPEDEQERRSALTWDQQQTVWAHRDAWEAWMDGEMDLAATRAYIAELDPLPAPPAVKRVPRS